MGLFAGDNSSTGDDFGHNTSNGLYAEGKGSHINEQKIFGLFGGLATENTTLNSSTVSNSLVGVNTTVGFLSVEEFFDKRLNLGDTG